MKHWTFSRKVSLSIAAASLLVVLAVSGFVYTTFKHWNDRQVQALLDAKLDNFATKMSEVSFLPSLLKPGAGGGSGAAAIFKPDLSSFAGDLEAGQQLEVLDTKGRILAEVGAGHPADSHVAYMAERTFSPLVYGKLTLRLIDTGKAQNAAAEREIGRLLLLGLLLAVLAAGLAGWIVTRSALKPIRGMIREVRAIGADNLGERLHLPNAQDEIHQLGDTFNALLEKLELSFNQQRRFVADASHELKTPLAIIEGHTHMMQRWGKASPEVLEESLAYLMEETRRMKELTASLLLLAETEEPLPEEAAETCLLTGVVRELLPQAGLLKPGVAMVVEEPHPEDLTSVRMPEAAAYQVLRNIVENAVKYTPEGGEVRIGYTVSAGQVTVTVSDTGIGIGEDELPHVFDRFYRAEASRSRSKGGSGLGLSIVRTIMLRYGGSVGIESAPGRGTTVTLKFKQAGG
ncbi:cell wall metabolism sensor histidine kinase WalK [Paenibacillus sp. NFR01]|uniref:sensor histidine kinase n=1 Tax=Paenibacillus sp. NFR01 TaxID=1566279 RepID=UPI0008B9C3FF|nr:HAMP domain-containing sensor histidine kinase [Paenibacillus sp. NFR01]SET97020.1 HAMP domain-containing protein [Paenibacillus sp. NFR01]